MRDVLPPEVIELIGSQYFNSIREAEPGFRNYQADEDAITGALGSSMDRMVKGSYGAGGSPIHHHTTIEQSGAVQNC